MRDTMRELVIKTVRRYAMIAPGDAVLVAVSGGPDSVFLLHMLYSLRNKLRISRLIACNLDHCLRGEESREDSLFVRRVCREMGIRYIGRKADIGRLSENGRSIEETARDVRYRFFRDAAVKARTPVIATGHTLDDQAETILMRVVKGSSLKGLVGVPPVRDMPSGRSRQKVRIVRPLIEIEKAAIVRYLTENAIAYRTDRSNDEPVYFRNRVRNEIMPFLERYNPRLKHALCNLAEHLREDHAFIDDMRKRSRHTLSVRNERVELRLKDIVMQPRAIQKEVARDALLLAGGKIKKLSFGHWKEIERLIASQGKGASVDLPGGIRITRTGSSLVWKKRPC